MSDQLAKQLHHHLSRAAEACGEKGWPNNYGWKDFLCGDRPETGDPLEMAFEAVWYLADCDGGVWRKPKPCMIAAVSFLKSKGMVASPAQLAKLPALLTSPPDRDSLRRWFYETYES